MNGRRVLGTTHNHHQLPSTIVTNGILFLSRRVCVTSAYKIYTDELRVFWEKKSKTKLEDGCHTWRTSDMKNPSDRTCEK